MKRTDAAEIARKETEEREKRVTQLRRMMYAERVTRILCRRSGLVDGFKWGMMRPGRTWRPSAWCRTPPLPFHSMVHKGAGWCRVCGQPIYGEGSFRKFAGPVSKLTWHNACLSSYFLWTKPSDYAELLIHRQEERCAVSGVPITLPYSPNVDVDHDVPLFRVARDHADEPWHDLIRFWGFGNLRAVTHAAHLAKNAEEAKERKQWRAVDSPIDYGSKPAAQ